MPRYPLRLARPFALLCCLVLLSACAFSPMPQQQAAPAPTIAAPPTVAIAPTAPPTPLPPTPLPPTATPAPPFSPTFESSDCPFDPEDEPIECGYLTVLENRNRVGSTTIRLAVALLPNRGGLPDAEPLLYLVGGPGGSALSEVWFWFDSDMRDDYDIILLDQRGTGYSEPFVECDMLRDDMWTELEVVRAARACNNHLSRQQVDPTAYNSLSSAADIEDLRVTLGYTHLNLLGISYGSRLALTYMRDFPDHVRSAILEGVYPHHVNAYEQYMLNASDALLNLLRACDADAECSAAYPNIEQTLLLLIERLDTQPIEYTLAEPADDGTTSVFLSGYTLTSAIFEAMYDTWLLPDIPRLIDDAAIGNYEPLAHLITSGETGYWWQRHAQPEEEPDVSDSTAIFYLVECNEEIPFNNIRYADTLARPYPPQLIRQFRWDVYQTLWICTVLSPGAAPPVENQPVVSDIPTLLLSGEFDPITPPAWGDAAAEHLSNSVHITIPASGHSSVGDDWCVDALVVAFLAEPEAALDTRCIDEIPPISFTLPDEQGSQVMGYSSSEAFLSTNHQAPTTDD